MLGSVLFKKSKILVLDETTASVDNLIQQSIPIVLTESDILARVKNGVGKTTAFSVPVHLLVDILRRILDLAKKGVCILKDCSMLVMDEADKLLSPEFQPSIEQWIQFFSLEPTNPYVFSCIACYKMRDNGVPPTKPTDCGSESSQDDDQVTVGNKLVPQKLHTLCSSATTIKTNSARKLYETRWTLLPRRNLVQDSRNPYAPIGLL